jgi:hypothetical protein
MNYAEGTILRQMMNCAPACPVLICLKTIHCGAEIVWLVVRRLYILMSLLAMAEIDLFNLLQLLLFWHMHSGPLQN